MRDCFFRVANLPAQRVLNHVPVRNLIKQLLLQLVAPTAWGDILIKGPPHRPE